MQRLFDWFDDRTGYRDLMKEALDEPIPGGARWRYVWGSTLVFTFFVQVVTGFVLWAAYSPSTRTAWESVYYIEHEMTLGWLVRGMHHFAAQAMVVLLVFHLVQVVIDGAYRAPREVNFWLGLVLMLIVLGLGLTGYLLPWDQKGYYATQVATEIMGSTPVIGEPIQKLVQGGSEYGHHTLTRFFALHAGLLPAALVVFLFLHIYVFRRHALHVKDPHRGPQSTFWPDQILKDGVASLAVLAAIMGLAVWKGAELTAPANPAEAYAAARPEWYYLFLFRFLKFEWVSQAGEATQLGEAFGSVVVPGVLMMLLVLMPLIAYIRGGHYFNVAYLWAVLLGAAGLTGLALYEDWYQDNPDSRDFRAAVEEAHRDGERTVQLARSPSGIPPEGAITLLQNDPLTQGPRLFRLYCADCHQPTSMADQFSRPSQAPELLDIVEQEAKLNLGTREWVRSVLIDFDQHFAALKNIEGERAEAAVAILDGDMASWSADNRDLLSRDANQQSLAALVEFVVAQSGRVSVDADLVNQGRAVFVEGRLADGELEEGYRCVDCHSMHALGEDEALSTDGYGPILTNYSGSEWLKSFITNPEDHYTSANAMPGFTDQLSAHDLDMLVRWMTGDYYRGETE